MAVQLDYGYSTPKAVPGAKVDLVDDVVEARINDENDGVVKYGTAVAVGASAGHSVKKTTATTTAAQIDGVVICHPNTEQDMNGNVVVKKNATLGVMKKGHIWGRLAVASTSEGVDTYVTPTYGATAYVCVEGANAGCFTPTASSTSGSKTVDIGAKFGYESDNNIAVIVL